MKKTTASDRRNTSQAGARLLLSLLLLIAPLMANAAGIPMMHSGIGTATSVAAQMPCHSGDTRPMTVPTAAQADTCPHCTGDGAATQCDCCGHAAPAGLSMQGAIHPSRHADSPVPRRVLADPLPDSPDDRPYRPPIVHG